MFLASQYQCLALLIVLIAFFFAIMIIDNGPYDTKVNNILHVCNNALYVFVLAIMIFLLAKPTIKAYEEGE